MISEPFTDRVDWRKDIGLEIWEREKLAHIHIRFCEWVYKFGDFRAAATAEASPWSCHTSGDGNGALRPAHNLLSSPRRDLSPLSLFGFPREPPPPPPSGMSLSPSPPPARFLPPSSPVPSSPSLPSRLYNHRSLLAPPSFV